MEQLAANAVDPAFQGRGIGTQMARKVVHELIETRSQEILFVATLVHDKPARRVYEKIGFTEVYRQISFSNWKHLLDPQPLEAQAGGDSTAPAGANGSSTEWCIRAAGPADKDRLFEIALHDPAVRFSPERLMAARFGTLAGKTWQQRRTEQVQNQLESDRVFVAENGGSIGGYASLSWSAESEFGRVTYPSVDPESGDAGLHDRLLAHLLHQAREVASLRIVDIGVCAEDADAVTRCQGAGFEEFNCGIGFAMRRDEAVFS
jgi:hypothetical protein